MLEIKIKFCVFLFFLQIPKVLQHSDIGNLLNRLMKQCLNDMKAKDEIPE
jgi:hypothetical protein